MMTWQSSTESIGGNQEQLEKVITALTLKAHNRSTSTHSEHLEDLIPLVLLNDRNGCLTADGVVAQVNQRITLCLETITTIIQGKEGAS